jgi:hypothetical protein
MKSDWYEPYKYWDPFVERGDPLDEGMEKENEIKEK